MKEKLAPSAACDSQESQVETDGSKYRIRSGLPYQYLATSCSAANAGEFAIRAQNRYCRSERARLTGKLYENTRRGWLRKACLVAVGTGSWTMIGP